VQSYNPNSNTWAAELSLPAARGDLAAVLGYDGHIYAFGGTSGTSAGVGTNQSYQGGSGFAASTAAKAPAGLMDGVPTSTQNPVSLTVAPWSGTSTQWVAPSSRSSAPAGGHGGIDSVFANGTDSLAGDLADALFAGSIG
jgi:hypothetical protein